MPKKKTKNILIMFLVLDLILIAVFSIFYLYMKEQNIDTNDKENRIKNEIKKQEARSLMQEDLNESKIYGEKIKDLIIGQENIVGFIKIIEDLVYSSGLTFEMKSVSAESNDNLKIINSEYIRVKLDVVGEWKNIQFFLNLLENYPLKINIDKVIFTKFSDYEAKSKKMPQWLGSFEFTVIKIKDK